MALPAISAARIGGDLAGAAMAAQRENARIERRIGAARRVGRQRAADQRGAEDALDLEQAGERVGGGELGAVQEREPFLGPEFAGREPSAFERGCGWQDLVTKRASPTPIIAAAMCASGARSPEAPTEPWAGTTGVTPRASIASRSARVVGRTPEAPCASEPSFSAIISRVAATEAGSPTPAACDSTMLR